MPFTAFSTLSTAPKPPSSTVQNQVLGTTPSFPSSAHPYLLHQLPYIRYPVVVSRIPAISTIILPLISTLLFSYCEIAAFVVNIFSTNSSCVIPILILCSFILPPIVLLSIFFIFLSVSRAPKTEISTEFLIENVTMKKDPTKTFYK